MKDTETLPITPDFDVWPAGATPMSIAAEDGALSVTWADGRTCLYHPLLLAENDPAPDVLHPLSRETVLTPLDFPVDLAVSAAEIAENGALRVHWSNGRRPSEFHPGWLEAHGWSEADTRPQPVLWDATLGEPPTFDGPAALDDPRLFRDWLIALRDHGVARLRDLPDQDGLLVEIASRIGVIRETNFGRTYTLAIKPDPDSNAYTSLPLPQHIDLPTRECPPGLQFLFCRENSTTGGEGLYTDAYKVAEDLRAEEPDHFEALTTLPWTYNNRARGNSYMAAGPVVECDGNGTITGVRYNTWLRAPFVGPIQQQDRAYRAYRAFAERAQDPAYQLGVIYQPGDLFAFDNRRALHGRKGYDAGGGTRFIEGVYSDRDELHSAIRTLDRQMAQR
ncbi:MAG: TauD/TfdA family dioxygenase [Pseudomonadota bacterium]